MSTRTTFRPKSVITNGDMSAATITSDPTILQSLSLVSYAVSWSGTAPVGTLAVQVSDDYSLDSTGTVSNAGTWNTVTLNIAGVPTSSIAITGNTGKGYIEVGPTAAYAVRLLYTKTSGTGTFQATINAKVS